MTGRVNLVTSTEQEFGTESNPLIIKQAATDSGATSALQTAGNATLTGIETKLTDKSQFVKLTDGTHDADIFSNKALSVDDIYLAIARQEITGYTAGNKAGRNVDIDIGSEDVIGQGGTYTPPTTARVHNIASSSANDTAAGTGARTVSINGLLADYSEANETITMNGTTNVPTVNSYIFINRMRVETAGSTDSNVGTITATAVTDATISAQIDAAYGQAALGVFLVPLGKTMYLTKFGAAMIGTGNVSVNLMTKVFGGAYTVRNNLSLNNNSSTTAERKYDFPLRITEKTYVKIRATSSALNSDVSCYFDYLLVG